MAIARVVVVLSLVAACVETKSPVEDLLNPTTCGDCHGQHYTEWSGSMHAYASDDPVFLAMNRRGQRDTNGQLGTFCVQCHAPMAVVLGDVTAANAATFDPTMLPPGERGITCYFCHDVAAVAADHNNGLVVALDQTMRGGVSNPTDSPAHFSQLDKELMRGSTNKSTMCGSCHDVVTPRGIPLERTYQEWQTTIFASGDPINGNTCSYCHMTTNVTPATELIADKAGLDVKSRMDSFHEHLWPGIDQALTTFPDTAEQITGMQRDLGPALTIVGPTPYGQKIGPGGICVNPGGGGEITIRIDSRGPGHMWPSGASQDRRAWLEVLAYDASDNLIFSSGTVPDNMDPEDINDPNLFGFWDKTFKDDGTPAHFFWEVATEQSHLLRPPVTLDSNSPMFDHSSTATYIVGGLYAKIDHITAQVHVRPFSYAMLEDLVSSGDLDASIPVQLMTPSPALVIPSATRHWTRAAADPLDNFCDPNPYM